ncbi:unnamed protein product [Phytomonas sp. Hart1]|nr:unnamed protein product [Phytomonas sp. Hart1]|eukprot:CCW68983.1 unnamed protein product [Phytomonas sp. isolate Hart1]
MAKPAYKCAENMFLPIVGFATGWGAFVLLDQGNFLSSGLPRWFKTNQLKMRLHLQSLLPEHLVEKYGYPQSFLQDAILRLESEASSKSTPDRVGFQEILSQCGVRQQILYLEEHATEDIPYFYIADVFHAWATLHQPVFLHSPSHFNGPTENPPRDPPGLSSTSREAAEFESRRLCEAVWGKIQDGVLPFDVGVRVLGVLAVRSPNNARWMLHHGLLGDLLKGYEGYQQRLAAGREGSVGPVSPAHEVAAAMAALMKAFHDACGSFRWGFIPQSAFPLARRVDGELWCRVFYPTYHTPALTDAVGPGLRFVGAMCEQLRCSERIPLEGSGARS